MKSADERFYFLLLFLQLLVLHLLKLGPDGQHFLLQLGRAQLINVQHERKLNVLKSKITPPKKVISGPKTKVTEKKFQKTNLEDFGVDSFFLFIEKSNHLNSQVAWEPAEL